MKIGIGSRVLLREESTRIEEDFTLVESSQSDPDNEKFGLSSPLGIAFLGQKIDQIVATEIHKKKGSGEFLI